MAQKTIPERKNIPENHRWGLSPMLSSDEELNSLYSEKEERLLTLNLNSNACEYRILKRGWGSLRKK